MNLFDWWTRRSTAKVYHPEGKFDKIALIQAVIDVERRKLKPTHIVMTHNQHDDYIKESHWLMWQVCGSVNERLFSKFMGCEVAVDDIPRWCVGVEDEW